MQDERRLSMTLHPQYVCNLAAVARPAAAWSGAPTIAREARRPTRGTPEESVNVVFKYKIYFISSFESRAIKRVGVTGPDLWLSRLP
jgi:hypothetical protein